MGDSAPAPRELACVELTSRPGELRRVRAVVERAAGECGCTPACTRDMVIAVDEACQNVIRHGYGGRADGRIRLEVRRLGSQIEFVVVDWAPRVDIASIKPRELEELRPGGLGTRFMRECMDECEYLEPGESAGNRLRMRKRIQCTQREKD